MSVCIVCPGETLQYGSGVLAEAHTNHHVLRLLDDVKNMHGVSDSLADHCFPCSILQIQNSVLRNIGDHLLHDSLWQHLNDVWLPEHDHKKIGWFYIVRHAA